MTHNKYLVNVRLQMTALSINDSTGVAFYEERNVLPSATIMLLLVIASL